MSSGVFSGLEFPQVTVLFFLLKIRTFPYTFDNYEHSCMPSKILGCMLLCPILHAWLYVKAKKNGSCKWGVCLSYYSIEKSSNWHACTSDCCNHPQSSPGIRAFKCSPRSTRLDILCWEKHSKTSFFFFKTTHTHTQIPGEAILH